MTTLEDVQKDIERQLERHFGNMPLEKTREMCRCGLVEEVGEVMGVFKGRIRNYPKDIARCSDADFKYELGDVLWYLTALCSLYNISLEEIYVLNCEKLQRRYGV